jgi:hypothetical protein
MACPAADDACCHSAWVITYRPGQAKFEGNGPSPCFSGCGQNKVERRHGQGRRGIYLHRHLPQRGRRAIGILFPPSIIGTAIVGAAVGGVGGHLWRGMSRADVKEFGDVIDEGQAALVIVGESKLEQAVAKAELKAEKHVAKELGVSAKDVDRAVQEAAGELS